MSAETCWKNDIQDREKSPNVFYYTVVHLWKVTITSLPDGEYLSLQKFRSGRRNFSSCFPHVRVLMTCLLGYENNLRFKIARHNSPMPSHREIIERWTISARSRHSHGTGPGQVQQHRCENIPRGPLTRKSFKLCFPHFVTFFHVPFSGRVYN